MYLLLTRPMPVTIQGYAVFFPPPQHSGSRIHRSLRGGILIRRSSEESFRLCDDFVTERLVYQSHGCAEH